MVTKTQTWSWLGAIVLGLLAGMLTSVLPAAAVGTVCAAAAPACHSYNLPIRGGLDLDALNWGINPQTGTSYNDQLGVYNEATALRASDFIDIPVASTAAPAVQAGASGPFLIEFAPRDVASGYCVSTITDALGAYAKLRPCAANLATSAFNQWQSFARLPQGDGFFQLSAYGESTPMCLNDKGWGGNLTPVISYTCAPAGTAPENQIWEVNG